MNYKRFEDLPVWKTAIEFAVKVYWLTTNDAFKGHGSLRDQLERAAVSVSNNIAEGFERGTTQELLTFIYIARGSAGEARSMLSLLELLPSFAKLNPDLSHLGARAISISRQLGAWAQSLQNSEIKGQRYMTEKSRRADRATRDRDEFLQELRRMREERIRDLHVSTVETEEHKAGTAVEPAV